MVYLNIIQCINLIDFFVGLTLRLQILLTFFYGLYVFFMDFFEKPFDIYIWP